MDATQRSENTTEEVAPEVTPFDARAASPAGSGAASPAASGAASDGLSDSSAVSSSSGGTKADPAAEAELETRRKAARAQAVRRVKAARATKVLLLLAVLWVGALAVIQQRRAKIRQWRWAEIPMPADRVARFPER